MYFVVTKSGKKIAGYGKKEDAIAYVNRAKKQGKRYFVV